MEIIDLTLPQAQKAIEQLKIQKATIKNKISEIKLRKTQLTGEKKKLQEDKSTSNKRYQTEISRLKIKQQKDSKKKQKKSAAESFDTRIAAKTKSIQSLSEETAKLQVDISKMETMMVHIQAHVKFLIKIEVLKPKMLEFIQNGQYSQFSEAWLSTIYSKLTHEQKLKYVAFIADVLEKLDAEGNNILRNLSMDNLDTLLRDFAHKFKGFPSR